MLDTQVGLENIRSDFKLKSGLEEASLVYLFYPNHCQLILHIFYLFTRDRGARIHNCLVMRQLLNGLGLPITDSGLRNKLQKNNKPKILNATLNLPMIATRRAHHGVSQNGCFVLESQGLVSTRKPCCVISFSNVSYHPPLQKSLFQDQVHFLKVTSAILVSRECQ